MPALTTILIWGVAALVVVGVGYFIFTLVAASVAMGKHYDGIDPDAADSNWTDPVVLNLDYSLGELNYANGSGVYTGEVVDEEPHGMGLWFSRGSHNEGTDELEEISVYASEWVAVLVGDGWIVAEDFTFGVGKYDGSIYVGEFSYGDFSKGALISKDLDNAASKFFGNFIAGKPWNGTKTDYDEEENVTKIIIYSKGQIVSTIDGDRDKVLRDLADSYIKPYYGFNYSRGSLFDMYMKGELPSAKQLSVDEGEMLRVIEHMAEITGDTKWRDNRDD